jgi:hypothetical protein
MKTKLLTLFAIMAILGSLNSYANEDYWDFDEEAYTPLLDNDYTNFDEELYEKDYLDVYMDLYKGTVYES